MSLPLYIQLNRNSLMLVENDNISDNFMHYEKEEYPLSNKRQDIK